MREQNKMHRKVAAYQMGRYSLLMVPITVM